MDHLKREHSIASHKKHQSRSRDQWEDSKFLINKEGL